jgi:hypothetical protein
MKIGLIDVDGHNYPNLPLMNKWENYIDSDKSCIIVCKQCETIFALSDYQIVTEDKDE